jgi:DNA-binding NarL/FixJ family response regulator
MQPKANDAARPSLLIADDDAVVRAALSAQLAAEFDVVAAVGSASQAIAEADKHRPDAALIDVDMPEGGARAAVPEIASRSPGTCMVILSGDETRQLVVELLAAGAIAYVRKGISAAEIAETLMAGINAKAADAPA